MSIQRHVHNIHKSFIYNIKKLEKAKLPLRGEWMTKLHYMNTLILLIINNNKLLNC